ncbi:MAG: HNH endonuclease [Gammaproteobacteria bacterium]|nr:HNH endonuclease [Gammaproteobacteria bacterium]
MITQERLKEVLTYNPETGDFIWKVGAGPASVGDIAGCEVTRVDGKKYIVMGVDYKLHLAHRLAFLYMLGKLPSSHVDHGNGDGTDNRWANITEATPAENAKNCRRRIDNTSGVTGVQWNKLNKNWRAVIQVKRETINLGSFKDLNGAILARKEAEKRYGFHENHGSSRAK